MYCARTPPQSPRHRATLKQRIASTAVELSYAVVRAEDYREHLVDQVHLLFRADAGAGLTRWRPNSPDEEDELAVVVAGAPPLTREQGLRARPYARTHPGFAAMALAGTMEAIRVSDHTDMARFWTTDAYRFMHGHSEGRYPASALLLHTPGVQIFVGLHRHDRDFSDADLAGLTALQRPLAAALAFRAALDEAAQLLVDAPHVQPGERRGRARHQKPGLGVAVELCQDYAPTRREGEVLTLAAQGWTNQQIGRRLGITERTVRKHLSAVYDQAGVRGRAAAAAWWQHRNR
jgi:DNA-binding CsgD family transcriptional regulator